MGLMEVIRRKKKKNAKQDVSEETEGLEGGREYLKRQREMQGEGIVGGNIMKVKRPRR